MSSDRQPPKRSMVSRNLRLAYGEVTAESVPERFARLLRRLDGEDDDDLDPGIGAEPPQRPRGGPKTSGAVETPQRIK